MCLYPVMGYNPKYRPNKKNNFNPANPKDSRVKYMPYGCGECDECRAQKANEWRVRLNEELKHTEGHFITLTFSNESLDKIIAEIGKDEANEVAYYAIRHWSENWRKKTKKQPKRWLITELGHPSKDGSHISTQRVHIHGILFEKDLELLKKTWSYGRIHIGEYCNIQTINYIVKYVTKRDEDHKGFKARIFTSKGIGSQYIDSYNARRNKYNGTDTNEMYRLENGQKVALPMYYRNKIYSDEEREQLWLQKLNENKRYIKGVEIDISTREGLKKYYRVLQWEQEQDKKYGFEIADWKKEEYKAQIDTMRTEADQGKRTSQERSESGCIDPIGEGSIPRIPLVDSFAIDSFELER